MNTSEPYRILITGWRDWPESHAFVIDQHLDGIAFDLASRPIVIVHGKCPYGGVDLYAERWANKKSGATHEPHPAQRTAQGKILGPARNSKMVNLGANVCLSFPGPGSRGTWDCTSKAVDADIPTYTIAWSTAWAKEWQDD